MIFRDAQLTFVGILQVDFELINSQKCKSQDH